MRARAVATHPGGNGSTGDPVVFLHIPKTAGTTMRAILARQYKAQARYEITNDINESIIRFRQLPAAEHQRFDLLQGHMSFGLHRYLRPQARYVTILREPISRAISDYAFVSSTKPHPLYDTVSKMSIGEYMQSRLTGQLSNGQTRLLCGDCENDDVGIPTTRDLAESDLDQARRHVQTHFSVVGLQERFDESLILMRRRLGWGLPLYVKENVTRRSNKPNVDAADLELIHQQNQLDLTLYAEVTRELEHAVATAGMSFRIELIAFRALNRLYKTLRLAHPHTARRMLGPKLRPFIPRK